MQSAYTYWICTFWIEENTQQLKTRVKYYKGAFANIKMFYPYWALYCLCKNWKAQFTKKSTLCWKVLCPAVTRGSLKVCCSRTFNKWHIRTLWNSFFILTDEKLSLFSQIRVMRKGWLTQWSSALWNFQHHAMCCHKATPPTVLYWHLGVSYILKLKWSTTNKRFMAKVCGTQY